MSLWFLFSFMLGLRGGWGERASYERVRNCSHVMGHYVSQQCQTAHSLLCKAVRLKFSRIFGMSYKLDLSKKIEIFEVRF
jgi:hypothetical protein